MNDTIENNSQGLIEGKSLENESLNYVLSEIERNKDDYSFLSKIGNEVNKFKSFIENKKRFDRYLKKLKYYGINSQKVNDIFKNTRINSCIHDQVNYHISSSFDIDLN